MRADLEELVDSLVLLHRRKLSLLEGFARSLADKRYFLRTGDTERLAEAVACDNSLFELIDTIDFEIGSTIDRMAAINGTDRNGLEDLLKKSGSPGAAGLFEIRSAVRRVLKNSSVEHDELIHQMEKVSSKIRSDADSLSGHLKFEPFDR